MKKTKNDVANHCVFDEYFLEHDELKTLTERFGTPLFVYDEKGLRQRTKSLLSYFTACGTMNYFPVEKCPLREILQVLADAGMGALCQSEDELRLALSSGFPGDRILYAAMILGESLALELRRMNSALLAGSELVLRGPLPARVLLFCRTFGETKKKHMFSRAMPGIGFDRRELEETIPRLRESGVQSVGIGLRYDGNVTDEAFLASRLTACSRFAAELKNVGCPIDHVHLMGGLGIRYRRVDLQTIYYEQAFSKLHQAVCAAEHKVSLTLGTLFAEPAGIFAAKVLGVLDRLGALVVLNAHMEDIALNPAERYRHISVSGNTVIRDRCCCDVVSEKPALGQWFGKNRLLPLPAAGDLLVFHDAGCSRPANSLLPVLMKRQDGTVTVLQHGEKQQCADADTKGG